MDIPSERASQKSVFNDYYSINEDTLVKSMINAFPGMVAVLNEHRQIVHANQNLKNALNTDNIESILGRRPGEAIQCINVEGADCASCGNMDKCKYCGAITSIMEAQNTQKKSEHECNILIKHNEVTSPFEFKVITTPFMHKGKLFYIFSLDDISEAKRKKAIERIFYHDILNTSTQLKSLVNLFKKKPEMLNNEEFLSTLSDIANDLTDDILFQRDLQNAELGDLKVKYEEINPKEILSSVVVNMRKHSVAENRSIKIVEPDEKTGIIVSDRYLIKRILINMIKNALEASAEQETVTCGYGYENGFPKFWIHNNQTMSQAEEAQVFTRSFSTKGIHRGLGTYSMKLLGEQYLKGKVDFTTSPEKGTTFSIKLPNY